MQETLGTFHENAVTEKLFDIRGQAGKDKNAFGGRFGMFDDLKTTQVSKHVFLGAV